MKKLLKEWEEKRKMKDIDGVVKSVTVTCREYEYHYKKVEMYAVADDGSFGTPIYTVKQFEE